jgi:predicted peptidase
MPRRVIFNLLLAFLFFWVQSVSARETGFLNRTVTVGSTTYRYQVYVPANYNLHVKLPVILFLHGADFRGDDGILPTDVALGKAIRRHNKQWPAIVVFPQCRFNGLWFGDMETLALKALDESVKEFHGDSQRLYLIGESMGGYGVWSFAAHHPGKFAALVPIAGGVMPPPNFPLPPEAAAELAGILKSPNPYALFARLIGNTPVWVFHGDADTLIPVTDARKLVQALKTAGGNARYTEYVGGAHNIWEKVYAEPDFNKWLLSQQLNK